MGRLVIRDHPEPHILLLLVLALRARIIPFFHVFHRDETRHLDLVQSDEVIAIFLVLSFLELVFLYHHPMTDLTYK